ncbi:hypothetical protein CA54_17760 [Symmachiella macrocystis]|uniref:Uncharacterized protein n=1 Tax=Symmachiella macrocystis TaxID=2527985 RepID=A0A5C6BLF8_9PLAN|nr:hypothetical protein [Symmachiella macrocystis]TWU12950.1 hypothetical protein CA54_17760 [Symmachiella macrocystis]
MLKTGIVIFACFCIATVITEAVGLGVLWSRGQLNQRTFREIEVILTGSDLLGVDVQENEQETRQLSLDEISDKRVTAILGIEKRENLAKQLLNDVMKFRDDVTAEQKALIKDRELFNAELQQVNERNTAEATELARGILLASSPKVAVDRLMELTVEEDVILLRGMPDENIAKILKEFKTGLAQERAQRARLIYESIYRGEPTSSVINKHSEDGQPQVTTPAG